MPNLSRAWGESSLLPFGCKLGRLQLGQIRVASTAIHHHLLHSHRLHSRPDQVQNPNSKRAVWILDFGVWILEFGVWILDFGVWILDFGFWISLVFVLFVAAPNGAVWILDFGFWSLDFGFWILDFGLDEALPDIVWILHKIFPCHADSGRRIFHPFFSYHAGDVSSSLELQWHKSRRLAIFLRIFFRSAATASFKS